MREEHDGGGTLRLLIAALILVGVFFLVISFVIHVLHFLLFVAIIWLIVMIGLAGFRLGRRRGP